MFARNGINSKSSIVDSRKTSSPSIANGLPRLHDQMLQTAVVNSFFFSVLFLIVFFFLFLAFCQRKSKTGSIKKNRKEMIQDLLFGIWIDHKLSTIYLLSFGRSCHLKLKSCVFSCHVHNLFSATFGLLFLRFFFLAICS